MGHVLFRSVSFRLVADNLQSELSSFVSHALVALCALVMQTICFRFPFSRRLRNMQKSHVWLSSAWKNVVQNGGIFMKIDIRVFCSKSCRNIQFSLKSNTNNWYLTSRPLYISDHIWFSSSQNDKYFRENCVESQNSNFTADCGKRWKITGAPGKPQTTVQYGACALLTG
jgi:hypothetical protein